MNVNKDSIRIAIVCAIVCVFVITPVGIITHHAGTATMGFVVGAFVFVGVAAAHAQWHE